MDDQARFWAKVDKAGPIPQRRPDLGPCWLWTAGRTSNGYGAFRLDGKQRGAHVVAYELMVGPVPEGKLLDHLCRVHHCVNPRHAEPVTNRENVLRGEGRSAANARKTHCPRGHEYNPTNTRIDKTGRRVCRPCQSAHSLAHYHRTKERM